ncbi:MAG: C1 family peptidase [Bacteriovorax sp.]
MKYKTVFSCFVFLQLMVGNSRASTLILEEIQKSIATDFKLQGKMKMPEEKVPDAPQKQLSKGELAVQEQLRLNREKVKEQHAKNEENGAAPSGSDFLETKKRETEEWRNKKRQEISDWQKEKQEIINQWLSEKRNFNKRIPQYKANLISEKDFVVSAANIAGPKSETPDRAMPINVDIPVFPDFYVIDKALDVEIKDQGQRPTCAAFTGIRAVEILMSQQGKIDKLSEQYFFWASIPKCQTTRCKKEGSWVYNAYQKSLEAKSPNIPLEEKCPYNQKAEVDNVTQFPLDPGCNVGYAKIKKFSNVLTSAEILNAIKAGHPVIGGFKLSENFYKNNGYVFEQSAKQSDSKLDEHAGGHAVLLVGMMKLPSELHQKEGKFCLISANSWGPGWGVGGHACMSERWINEHRFNVPFVALEEVETI